MATVSYQPRVIRRSDVLLALFVVAIAAMLLMPLPTPLLDFLLVINLSFAFLLLLTALYIPNALALLAFPTILLLTTLFRLSLNVASTRLILIQGDAGEVIRTFGTLLIGSEIVVGVIIFCIITIVNFIVIAKGSARVSEVAARFALDAMPGKQMAIDADLRAGLLSAEQAQSKRDELRKESQLYGAMDGAMRFVQGDAIAGICIIFTNIIGGLYMGVVNGNMSLSDAVHTYTVLTVGDGLVHQIPALLISICAGIVVTRVSSGEDTTLGGEVGTQIFARPGTMLFAGVLLVVIGEFTVLPKVPFIVVGLAFAAGSVLVARAQKTAAGLRPEHTDFSRPMGALLPSPADEEESAEESILAVVLDANVLYRLYKLSAQKYHAWWREFQADFFFETGMKLPELSVAAHERLPHASYSLLVGGSEVESGRVLLDSLLVEVRPEQAGIFGLEVGMESEHPLSGERVFWAAQTPALRRVVEGAGIRAYDFFEYIGLRAGVFFARHPEELLTVAEVHRLLRQIEKKHPGLLGDAFGKGGANVARLTELLQELVREGVSLRDFRQVVEQIATYCSINRVSLGGEEEIDVQDIVTYVRSARRRQLTAHMLSYRRTLRLIAMSEETAALVEAAELDGEGSDLAVDPEVLGRLREGLQRVLDPIRARGVCPVTVLCRRELRARVSRFLRACGMPPAVVTYEELDTAVPVETVGSW